VLETTPKAQTGFNKCPYQCDMTHVLHVAEIRKFLSGG
jgi:hypothetical protein